jgi:hypothetical protein
MFKIFLQFFFIDSTLWSDTNEEYNVLTKFIDGFNDETSIQNWIISANEKKSCVQCLFIQIIRKVRDILLEIKAEMNAGKKIIKSLVLETNMHLKGIGEPYFETFVIIKSLKRILDRRNEFNLGEQYTSNFRESLYREFENISFDLKWIFFNVGLKYNKTKTESLPYGCRLGLGYEEKFTYMEILRKNILITTDIMNLSNNMMDLILPNNICATFFIKAYFTGFIDSRKCSGDGIDYFIKEKSVKIFDENMMHFQHNCSTELSIHNKIDIKHYMNIYFECNLTTVKLLLTLFQFYSEIREKNTLYAIKLLENNKYQIVWTISDKQPLLKIKNFWLQKKIQDLSEQKIIHKFGFLVDYETEFSMVKSAYTEDYPIETKLILLSCGHHLGFELINEFLAHIHSKSTRQLMCYICRVAIWILGSYDAEIYRCIEK